jgi:hypothetical protein
MSRNGKNSQCRSYYYNMQQLHILSFTIFRRNMKKTDAFSIFASGNFEPCSCLWSNGYVMYFMLMVQLLCYIDGPMTMLCTSYWWSNDWVYFFRMFGMCQTCSSEWSGTEQSAGYTTFWDGADGIKMAELTIFMCNRCGICFAIEQHTTITNASYFSPDEC